jgi:hypothetical protein
MSDTALIDKLDALQAGSDFTDPQTYRDLLYGQQEEAAPPAQPQGETAAAPAPAPAPAESSAPPAAAEPTKEEPVATGVATRDGKHVIPYQVLENERAQRRDAERREAEALAKLARLEGQGATSSEKHAAIEALFSPEELADMESDFPAMKKLSDAYTALAAKVAADEAAKSAAQAQTQQVTEDEARDVVAAQVSEAIKGNALLATWQARGGGLWTEAKATDAELLADPVWSAKPMAERFAEVQRRVAEANGIPLPPTPGKNTSATTPTPRPAAPVKEVLPTLTDFNGGPMAVGDPMAGMQAGQMVDAAMGMSMEEIRRMVGLSY